MLILSNLRYFGMRILMTVFNTVNVLNDCYTVVSRGRGSLNHVH